MRIHRQKSAETFDYHHCLCRCVGNDPYLRPEAIKDKLQEFIWQISDFSGITVITYAILDTHFQVLVRVPPRNTPIPKKELERRFRSLYGNRKKIIFPDDEKKDGSKIPSSSKSIPSSIKVERDGDDDGPVLPASALFSNYKPAVEPLKEARIKKRMHDVSTFMSTLKQKFTTWFNKEHGRVGTCWTERFYSLHLPADDPGQIAKLAASIDQSPVNAGLCQDSRTWHWCGHYDFLNACGIYDRKVLVYPPVSGTVKKKKESLNHPSSFTAHEFYRDNILPIIEDSNPDSEEFGEAIAELKKSIRKRNNKAYRDSIPNFRYPPGQYLYTPVKLRNETEEDMIKRLKQLRDTTEEGENY